MLDLASWRSITPMLVEIGAKGWQRKDHTDVEDWPAVRACVPFRGLEVDHSQRRSCRACSGVDEADGKVLMRQTDYPFLLLACCKQEECGLQR
jgi:hypothetical protein